MDETTKKLVTDSWAKLLPIADQAGQIFYDKLFELDPGLPFLFKEPIPRQIKLLMGALNTAISCLDDLDTLVPVLQDMGKRHAGYGVAESDYATVGEAFLFTLGQGLGDGFSDEIKAAWEEVYGVVAGVMIEAAKEVQHDGPLSPRHVRVVQGSWAQVEPIADQAATLFYDRLFELDPTLRGMFPEDLAGQKKKLVETLSVAVDGLTDLEALVPVVKDLGVRHMDYGVEDAHYETVGAALLDTLGKGLGDGFTDDVKSAWVATYALLAETMKTAAAEAQAPSPEASTTARKPAMPAASATAGIAFATIFIALGVTLAALTH